MVTIGSFYHAADSEYLPRILVTGEKSDGIVIQALKEYTQQDHELIPLEQFQARSTNDTLGYNKEKDLLLLLIHKIPGHAPIRGFAPFDGPLNRYRESICSFTHRAALVILHPAETVPVAAIQQQAVMQLPEAISKVLPASSFEDTAQTVHSLLSSIPGIELSKKSKIV